jgi:competence protein ComEC
MSARQQIPFTVVLFIAVVGLASFFTSALWAQPPDKALKIYFVDVEGGQASLFVTPTGESLLIDTGWPGFNGRDADRIVEAARDAGISKIDYVLITHFHMDHAGGAPQLADRIPIGTFIDHGENRESTEAATTHAWQEYQRLLQIGKYKHIIAKPGDKLPLHGIDTVVASGDGAVLAKPLPGSGRKNPACKNTAQDQPDQTENGRSLGLVITFGKLRILDLGDLTEDKERELMCPVNRFGKFDIYVVSHQGFFECCSSEIVHGIDPRVAIMDNGARKGGSPAAWDIVESSPHLENLWQLHYSEEGGVQHNVPAEFIANKQGSEGGNYLLLTARPDGSFAVLNSRTGKTKRYPAR